MSLVVPLSRTTHRGTAARTINSLRVVATAAAKIHSAAAAAEGRRRTQRALLGLEREGWRVAHRIQLPDGRHADHLVIGPGGVFLLDSKAWRGLVTVDQKGATITPEGDRGAAWTARGQHRSLPPAAAHVARTLAAGAGGALPPLRPVVVVWAPFPERIAVTGGVTYVAGEHLGEWLSQQPTAPIHRPGTDRISSTRVHIPAPRTSATRPAGV